MNLYSYQGKQWVIQGDLVAELKLHRHAVEAETRQGLFRSRHVRVLIGPERQAFLKANNLTRAGGKIALIERKGAELIQKRLTAPTPVQQPLPYHKFVSGLDRLLILTATFRGESLAYLEFDGRRCIPATVLGKMLGYSSPSELVGLIRREWKGEFNDELALLDGVSQSDYAILDGKILKDFKSGVKLLGPTHLVHAKTSQLLVLFESGVNKVLLKTQRPDGIAVRDFLAKDIMPKLHREPPVTPKTFFLNEQHELPPIKRATPTGMVTGGLSDLGADRFHKAITLNTSFALADKLVNAGQVSSADALAVQVALVKEFGGVDIRAMAQALNPKPAAETVTHPAPPAKIPRPKQDMLPTVKVGEEWTLATTDEEVYTIGEASQKLRQETGRPITVQVLQKLAQDLKIHIHYDTKPRSRTSAGVPYLRMSDFFRIRRYLAENPNVFPAL